MVTLIPLENLGVVLFADLTALERILLEEQVEGLVTAGSLSYVHELIVVPLLAENSLGPNCGPAELTDELGSAALADKCAEEDNSVSAFVDLAVKTPFVVRLFEQILQVASQLGINLVLRASVSHNLNRALELLNRLVKLLLFLADSNRRTTRCASAPRNWGNLRKSLLSANFRLGALWGHNLTLKGR